MNLQIGEKIRSPREGKNISQEVLAQYLGVSFQAVSKWENGDTLPDVTLIPAIASFFEVSTDELFSFDRMNIDQNIQQACWDIAEYRYTDPQRAEKDLRDLLKQYPGNDVVLANLLYSLQVNKRYDELVDTCKALIESTKYDELRFDAARILAETYKQIGEYALCKQAIDLIPEFFFSHREEKALLLDGEDMFRPAWQEKCESIDTFISMTLRLADYYQNNGEKDKANNQFLQAKAIIEILKDDLTPPFWKSNIYDAPLSERLAEIDKRLEI